MRRVDIKPVSALTAAVLWVGLGVASCAEDRAVVTREGPSEGPGFVTPDASASAESDGASSELRMCPVTTCKSPRTTCPTSRFPCDVDLLHDNENCGACGVRCGYGNPLSDWGCVEGECVFACWGPYSDCDGDPSNGCEISTLSDLENCGACGIRCGEGLTCELGKCVNGCQRNKPDKCDGVCTNLSFDDDNCGVCGNVCDRTGPNLPPLPDDMHYGCEFGTCGKRKCSAPNKANCNGDLADGCEITLRTSENCARCGDACRPGKECAVLSGALVCACEDDQETLCGGRCKRLDDDPQNCGGCDHACPGLTIPLRPHFSATCMYGVCGGKCADGFEDCDEFGDNGCETDIRVDNRNCGACGNACLPNQVCSDGKCLMGPCDAGEPGIPTK